MRTAQTGALWRIVSTRMPTKWGMFDAIGFERDISNDTRRVETALAIVMGDLTKGVPLLRIHSQRPPSLWLGNWSRAIEATAEIADRRTIVR